MIFLGKCSINVAMDNWYSHLPARWPWASYLISTYLNFLVCRVGMWWPFLIACNWVSCLAITSAEELPLPRFCHLPQGSLHLVAGWCVYKGLAPLFGMSLQGHPDSRAACGISQASVVTVLSSYSSLCPVQLCFSSTRVESKSASNKPLPFISPSEGSDFLELTCESKGPHAKFWPMRWKQKNHMTVSGNVPWDCCLLENQLVAAQGGGGRRGSGS